MCILRQVTPLVLLSENSATPQGGGLKTVTVFSPPLTNFTTSQGPAYTAITTVSTIANSGAVVAGVPYYVRFAAVNGLGTGAFSGVATNGNKTQANAVGQVVPRSPPGLPRNVLVYAVPSSQGDWLKVTWQEGETYGTPILWYDIQLRNTTGTNSYGTGWQTLHTVPQGVLTASGNTTYEQRIAVTPYLQYEVRVVAHNNLGSSGPSWFTQVEYDPLLINAVTTANDYHNGSQRATPTCEIGLEQCSEILATRIVARGSPGKPSLQVPLYPDATAAPSFTKNSGMVYFGLPKRNGQLVDKWRVEWSTDSSFPPLITNKAVLLLPQVNYNITGLTRGTTYWIRATAHSSLGYGAVSASYPFTPREKAGAPFSPQLVVSTQATDLMTYARSLNVTWGYPQLLPYDGDVVGDGGLSDVSSYLVEWSKQPFSQFTPTVQTITIQCNNLTIPFQRFRLRAQTNNSMNQPHNSWYYHSPELLETGKYISADISVNATAHDMEVRTTS